MANRTLVHRACGISGINAVNKTFMASNCVNEGDDVHVVHSGVIVFSNGLTDLGQFGSSTGRIGGNFRYNIVVRSCGSVHVSSIVRTCRVIRVGGWYSATVRLADRE